MDKNNVIATIALVILATFFFSMRSLKNKNTYWKGNLIKKKDFTDEDNENHMYRLIFKTDQGKTVKATVDEQTYNNAQVGDIFEKLKGEYVPKKIS